MNVLYVDDEPDIRDIATMALQIDDGIAVVAVESGAQALAQIAQIVPDVVMLDVMMPDMDGPTTLARLRELPAASVVPVIFITARTQAHEVSRFRALGAIGVIPKPFDPMTLARDVRALVDAAGVS